MTETKEFGIAKCCACCDDRCGNPRDNDHLVPCPKCPPGWEKQ